MKQELYDREAEKVGLNNEHSCHGWDADLLTPGLQSVGLPITNLSSEEYERLVEFTKIIDKKDSENSILKNFTDKSTDNLALLCYVSTG